MRLGDGDGRAVLGVIRGALRLRRFLVGELGVLGLTPMQVELLREIRRENRASQAFLARQLQVTRQAVDRSMVELERQELVDRAPDTGEDGRSDLWWLTDEGRSRLDSALDIVARFEVRCFGAMTEEERNRAAEVIERGAEAIAYEERMQWFPLRRAMW